MAPPRKRMSNIDALEQLEAIETASRDELAALLDRLQPTVRKLNSGGRKAGGLSQHPSRQHLTGRQIVEELGAFESESSDARWLRSLRAAIAWAIDGFVAGFAAYGEAMCVVPLHGYADRENSMEKPVHTHSRSVAHDSVQRREIQRRRNPGEFS